MGKWRISHNPEKRSEIRAADGGEFAAVESEVKAKKPKAIIV